MEPKNTVSLMKPMPQCIVVPYSMKYIASIARKFHIKPMFVYAFVSQIKYKIKIAIFVLFKKSMIQQNTQVF